MLVNLKFNNAFIFSRETQFSLKADMRNKRLSSNVIETSGDNVIKSACIYGANNSGKTCVIKVIRALWGIIMNKPSHIMTNMFSKSRLFSVSCVFIEAGKEWRYSCSFDCVKNEVVYESFARIDFDQYKNEKEDVYFERDFIKQKFSCKDALLEKNLTLMGRNNILIHVADYSSLEYLKEAQQVLTGFASRIIIVDMNNIPLNQTMNMMKNHDALQKDIVSFVKNADLDLDDFMYVDADKMKIDYLTEDLKPAEDVIALRNPGFDESLRLTSVYRGIPVPSLLFDSTGTKKIAALASYVVNALKKGQILVIDELDSSIHFKLSRSIVSMFNNELNDNAQLIFTAHDVSLMDCKKLFRKEQIWFVHKDKDGVYLYSLASFTAKDGVRETTDIIEKYKRGVLGAIPEPDMLKTLLQVKNG